MYQNIIRYAALKLLLIYIEHTEAKGLLLTDIHDKDVDELLRLLQDFSTISVMLPEDKTTVSLAQKLFAGAMEKFPRLSSRLADEAAVVKHDHFERAIFKIHFGSDHSLSRPEQRAVDHSLLTDGDTDQYIAHFLLSRGPLAADIKEQNKASVAPNGSAFMDLHFLLPTFNICERLFTSAGFTLGDRRKRT